MKSPAALLVSELTAAITGVSGPWLDLSAPSKLVISNVPGYAYGDVDNELLPMVILYTSEDTTNQAATTRHEVVTPVAITIISRPTTIDRAVDIPNTRAVGRQIVRALFARQRDGIAEIPLYLADAVAIDADCPESTIICSVRFTLTHLESE